jgi:predicted transposase/invertase (TIGR01784 family)
MEDMRNTAWNEGKIEGRIEGIKENAIETAKNLLRRGKYTLEEIAEDTQLPLEQVKELAGA